MTTANEPTTYSFGYHEKDGVACPEMDAFLDDLDAVLRKHGVGFELDNNYDENPKIVIVPYDKGDAGVFTGNLNEYGGGIPWLDRAKKAQIREAQEAQLHNQRAREAALINDGLVIDGKRYKLIEES